MVLGKSECWSKEREGSQTSRVCGGVSVSTPLDFGFLHYDLMNVSAFKGSLLALMLTHQRAV